MHLRRSLLIVIEALSIGLLVCLPILWLIGRVRFELGALDISMRWGPRPFAALAVLLAARQLVRVTTRKAPPDTLFSLGFVRKGLLAAGVIVVLLPVVDLLLARRGLARRPQPIVLAGADEWDDTDGPFVDDPRLLWRFEPGGVIHGQTVNRLGFPEREVAAEKPAGTMRVICMGDSCTADGVPPYSTILHEQLTNTPPGELRWEAFHNGVHGYSVVQGLQLFGITTAALEPDFVTLYFGWNGHWSASTTDRERISARDVRSLRGWRRRITGETVRRGGEEGDTTQSLRVPPAEYKATLARLVAAVRTTGARPMLITAPRATRLSRVLPRRHSAPIEILQARHDQYVELTREVAAQEGAALLDAAAVFEADPRRNAYFRGDGIHLRLAGRARMAELIYDALNGMTPEG